MSQTIAQAVQELERLKHERAVWMETVEHLSKFVDQEVRIAEQGIVAEGCVENRVPQPIVKEFIDYINQEEIGPLNQRIEEIENLAIVETKDNEPKDQKGPIRAETPAQTNKSPEVGHSGKKLRTVPGHPGRKAQGVS